MAHNLIESILREDDMKIRCVSICKSRIGNGWLEVSRDCVVYEEKRMRITEFLIPRWINVIEGKKTQYGNLPVRLNSVSRDRKKRIVKFFEYE